jgi:3-oxoacyl-[acyl-carrier-protein] synthase-3
MPNVGVYSIGTYLPEPVRRNDWWPESIVQRWRARQAQTFTRSQQGPEENLTDGMKLTVAAMLEGKNDPFEGTVERRVMPEGMRSSDMEVAAARRALDGAGIDPKDVDFLLTQSTAPNYVHVPNACIVHRELGLGRRCFSMATEGMCNAFLQQLVLAEQMIQSGRARYGLIIQSCNMTSFAQREDHFSPWFGDGAAAALVGPVDAGYGLLAHTHVTDGSVYGSVVTGIPGRRWWQDGPVIAYLESPALARQQFLKIADSAKPLLEDALAQAGLQKDDVRFWACHQPSPWLGRVTQEHIGFANAKRLDTYRWTASLSGANIPVILSVAEREGMLSSGDVVGAFAGAAGFTATGMVLRWGRTG